LSGTVYRLVRNSSAVSAGQMGSRLISVVYGIVLSRYLGAAGFGNIGAAIAITALAYVFVDFGLAPLMIRDVARDHDVVDRYASNVTGLKLLLMVLVNVGLAVFLGVSTYSAELKVIVWIYSLNCALSAIVGVGEAGLQGLEEMHMPALLQLGRNSLNVALSLTAIAMHAGIVVIVWISVVATAVQLVAMGVVAARNSVRASPNLVKLPVALGLFKESLPFAAFVLISTLYGQTAVLMVSLLMSMRETGLYAAAVNVSGLVGMLSGVFAQAVFPVFSRYHVGRPEMLRLSYEKMFKYMVILGFGLSTAAALAAKDALRLVLGAEYVPAAAATIVLVLSQALAANYINGALLNTTGRQRLFTISYAVAVVIQVGMSWWLIPRYGAVGAALGFLIPAALGYVYYTVLCHSFLKLPLPWLLHVKCLLAVGLMVLSVLGTARLGLGMLAGAILVGPLIYGATVLALHTLSRDDRALALEVLRPIWARIAAARGQQ